MPATSSNLPCTVRAAPRAGYTTRERGASAVRGAARRGAAVTLTQFFCRLAAAGCWLAGTTCSKLSQPGGVTSERSQLSSALVRVLFKL